MIYKTEQNKQDFATQNILIVHVNLTRKHPCYSFIKCLDIISFVMPPLISIVRLNYDASFITTGNTSLLMCDNEDFTIKGTEIIAADSRELQLDFWNFYSVLSAFIRCNTTSCF